jgi:hypothetical protein
MYEILEYANLDCVNNNEDEHSIRSFVRKSLVQKLNHFSDFVLVMEEAELFI